MVNEQARIRVSTLGGRVADLTWLSVVRIPPGIDVEVADFGYRVTVIVTRGAGEITLLADLGTGDVAESFRGDVPKVLREFARFVLEARMAVDGAEFRQGQEPTTFLANVVDPTGARWNGLDAPELKQR